MDERGVSEHTQDAREANAWPTVGVRGHPATPAATVGAAATSAVSPVRLRRLLLLQRCPPPPPTAAAAAEGPTHTWALRLCP